MIKVFNSFVGAEIEVRSFSLFVSICKLIAQDLHTLEEHREYPEYGWGSVWFMTDKFGGGYAGFHFDTRTNAVTFAKGHPEEEQVTSLERLIEITDTARRRMLKVRDMNAVSEFINSQY